MRIGIASPIHVKSFKKYLPDLDEKDLNLGLGGNAVNLLIIGLLNAGHKVTVFSLDPKINKKHVIEGEDLKIIFGHFRRSAYSKTLDFCSKEFLQIKNFITAEKNNLDIVNAHWSYEYAIGTILSDVHHIITFRDHSPTILTSNKHIYRLTRLLMDFWVRKNGDAFSYNSVYLDSKIGLKGNVIPNPIDTSIIRTRRLHPTEKQTFDIFFLANGWSYRKNPETAIRAFNILKKNNNKVHLHLIGSGYEQGGDGYHKMKGKYNLDRVHFRGFIDHTILMNLMTDFDLHLHTSREESFGNSLVEAMASGIPVVAGKDAGAVPWVLDGGRAGILVDITDPEQIALAIEKLVKNKEVYESFSKRGLNNVENRFTLEKVAGMYINAYKNLL